MAIHIGRRELIAALGSAAAWPLTARAQQAMPVIGFLDVRSPDALGVRMRAFHQGLKETGFVEGDNLSILYRFAENRSDRLAELAADCATGSRGDLDRRTPCCVRRQSCNHYDSHPFPRGPRPRQPRSGSQPRETRRQPDKI